MKKNIYQGSQEKLKPRNDDVTCPDRKSFKYSAIRREKEKDAIATTKLISTTVLLFRCDNYK